MTAADLTCDHGSLVDCRPCFDAFLNQEIALAELEESLEADCDECGRLVDPEETAPSCGAHVLHIECADHFRCKWCAEEQTDYPDEVPC